MSESTVVIALCGLGFYRRDFVKGILKENEFNFIIYSGQENPSEHIPVINGEFPEIVNCKVRRFAKGFQYLQVGVLELLRPKLLIMDLNPRALHVTPIVAIRRLMGRKTILWGHAFSRTGAEGKFAWTRNILRKLSNSLIVYTDSEKNCLKKFHPRKKIYSAPNALYPLEKLGHRVKSNRFRIVYVGRLIKSKKPELLLEAFAALGELKSNCVLTIVGSGDLLFQLKSLAKQLKIDKKVHFLGHIDEYEKLRMLYDESVVAVSTGYVGLSITQATGFGVPVIIADDEHHSPEIEGFIDNFNGLKFKSNDYESLAHKLSQLIQQREQWEQRRPQIATLSKFSYNSEQMVACFLQAIRETLK